MAFAEDEVAYLKSQPLARLATVGDDGQPDVVPVGFEFDGTHFYIGGMAPERTRKFLNVKAGHAKVALVVDDLAIVVGRARLESLSRDSRLKIVQAVFDVEIDGLRNDGVDVSVAYLLQRSRRAVDGDKKDMLGDRAHDGGHRCFLECVGADGAGGYLAANDHDGHRIGHAVAYRGDGVRRSGP